jgi:hypothetical protein
MAGVMMPFERANGFTADGILPAWFVVSGDQDLRGNQNADA